METRRRGAVEAGARSLAKRALRGYGMATSSVRRLPDFMIIGGKRCGTTSLQSYIAQHHEVAPLFPRAQKIKGIHFFDTNYHRGMTWYRSHFPLRTSSFRAKPSICGEASPYYLFHPRAAVRAHAAVPDVKIIVLFRDPVERAYSHYRERVRHGAEDLSFEEAIAAEDERLRAEEERLIEDEAYYSYAHENHSYVAQGRYIRSLRRWIDVYDRKQFLFLSSDDLFRTPGDVYERVCVFLDLTPLRLAAFERTNYHPASPLARETRARLVPLFAEDNEDLAALTGIDISDWSR